MKKNYTLQELEELIPDYIEGHCELEETRQIEDVMANNSVFSELVQVERRVAESLMDLPKEYQPQRALEHNLTRLKARIESEQSSSSWYESFMAWFKSPLPAALGVLFACVIAFNLNQPTNNQFTTLSDPSDNTVIPVEQPVMIRVIFDTGSLNKNQVPKRVETLKNLYSLSLIEGPDSLGSYVFLVEDKKQLKNIINDLNTDKSISFVGETVSP